MNGLPSSMESTLNLPLKIVRGWTTQPRQTAKEDNKMNQVKEFAEALIGCALIAGLAAAYCYVTPSQMSGETDWTAHETEIVEGGAK